MRIGASLFLIAVGAILRFAVTKHFSGIDVGTVGVVLMFVGVAGLLITLVLMSTRRRTQVVSRHGVTTYLEPDDSIDPRY